MTRASDEVTARRRGLAWIAVAYGAALAAGLGAGWAVRGLHPLAVAGVADVVGTLVVFAFSVALGNSSVYDPYWSVAPIPIAVYWASLAPPGTPGAPARQLVAVALVCAWGARLTANWIARWGGLGDEDFRYVEIRGRTGRLYWPASLVSIHLMPTAWVFLGLVPLYAALARPARPFGAADVAAAAVVAAAVAVEATADRQLRAFLRARRDPAAVLEVGLWGWSRHPNYFGEVLFWWGLFLVGVAARPAWAWSAAGAIAITLLFVLVSVPWMDRRMLAHHPEWSASMARTSALVPWQPRRRS